MVTAVLVPLVLVLAAAGITAAFWLNGRHGGASANRAAATGAASATSGAGDRHGGDLRGYLIAAPTGSSPWQHPLGTNGRLSLDQASALGNNAAERKAMLQRYGFRAGAVRCWIGADQSVVDIRLYQFDSPDDALGFFSADVRDLSAGTNAANITDTTTVPGGRTFAEPVKDTYGYEGELSIGRNGDVVIVVSMREVGRVEVSRSGDLLKQQYDKF